MANYQAFTQGLNALGQGANDLGDVLMKAKQGKLKAAQDAAALERQGMLDSRADSDRINKDYQFEREMNLKERELAAKKAAAGPVGGMTPGRKAADMAFGKDYTEFETTGKPTAQRGLETLETAKQEIKKTPGLTGPMRGLLPDWARAFTNPEAVNVKERIRSAVQNTLKSTLGAQFTEKEGERIFNQAYNDRLPPEKNIERIDAIIKELRGQTENKENMGQYFENKGTLTGYRGASTPEHKSLSAQILSDPEASPEDIAWAKQHVGE